MQCPNCAQELADQKRCQNCHWEEKELEVAKDPDEHGAKQASPDTSPAPPTGEEPPQAADSLNKPVETESPTVESPTGQPPTGEKAQPQEPVAPATDIKITVSGSTLDAKGNINIYGLTQGILGQAEQPDKGEEEKALYDLTKKLPARTSRHYHSSREELDTIVAKLRENRLILISSSFTEYALDLAYQAIENLAVINQDQNRIISYGNADKNLEFSIEKLFEQKPDVEGESVILVDALNTLARTFPNSILGHSARADWIKEDLRNKKHFLVVIVDLHYARQNDLAHQNFPYWEVPFLQPFLKRNFPSQHEYLEEQIVRQREEGLWERDELSFSQQVINYHYSGRLLTVVKAGGPKDPESAAESLLKASDQVGKTVLYTAAFFQETTSPEFCRVVAALLSKRTIRVTSQTSGGNGNGDTTATTQVEVPLSQTWEEEKDDIFTKLLLETSTGNDSVRAVSLSESGLREPLRRLFEKKHRFYLIDQFKTLQESGIFFYPSLRLAENTTQIAIEMARLYPDEFNAGWIVALVMRLREHFTADQSTAAVRPDPMFQFLDSSQLGALKLAFARVSDICRRMLESPQQKSIVQNSLELLMKNGCHEEVLWLIKQLKFSQEFDELYWLKQLLHRADPRTRRLTYDYLYSYLKRMGTGVYEGLTKIEAWLSPTERDTYSQFDVSVFRLLIQYCLETVDRFNAKHYGMWPSRYPLFVIKDLETAMARTQLLARWLLHPGIDLALASLRIGGTQMTLIGALLAEWRFILLGPNATLRVDYSLPWMEDQRQEAASEAANAAEYTAAGLFNLLFQQFASRTDLSQRLELLKYWNRLDHDLLKFLGSLSITNDLRKELTWKRNLVRELITEIKKAATTRKTRAVEIAGAVNAPSRQD